MSAFENGRLIPNDDFLTYVTVEGVFHAFVFNSEGEPVDLLMDKACIDYYFENECKLRKKAKTAVWELSKY